ncbi:MAG: nucleotidyltransferase family protein [Hormoscilla sp. GUM202]|nr:nucleotidyltransferase family protein [Hormoscilla sp. GUM202]
MPVIETLNRNIELQIAQIQDFCQRWHITEFALFGSVLRDDFRPDSDIDILVRFSPSFRRGLEETLQMRQELQTLFNRKVDLIEKTAIERSENWLRRKNILESAQAIYSDSQIDAIGSQIDEVR